MAEEEERPEAERPKCFIAMPISVSEHLLDAYGGDKRHFQEVMEDLHIPAVRAAGFIPVPPVVKGGAVIHAEIIANLQDCEMVLCDVSGHNPNVFLELGIRTALNKPVAVVKDSLTPKLPFDIGPVNTPDYSHALKHREVERDRALLADHIRETPDEQNALWAAFGLRIKGQRAIAESHSGDQGAALSLLASEVASLRREVSGPRGPRATKSWQTRTGADTGSEHFLADIASILDAASYATISAVTTDARTQQYVVSVDDLDQIPDEDLDGLLTAAAELERTNNIRIAFTESR